MEDSANLALWLAIWIAAIMAVLFGQWKRGSVGAGLILAYLLNLWLIHWVAASLYLLPWYQYFTVDLVAAGLQQSAYGVLAFACGSLVLAPIAMGYHRRSQNLAVSYRPHPDLPKVYIAIGGLAYLLLSSFLGRVPTASALVAVGQGFFVIGVCLLCWKAWQARDMKRLIGWLGITLCLPFVTIISQGFISYGMFAVFVVLTFIARFFRPRWAFVVVVLVLGYLGLSLYVSYMRDRGEIRQVVWGGDSLQDRVERVLDTLSTLEWFDPLDESQLNRIDGRLNQNLLVGFAVNKLAATGYYAYGDTMREALLAIIPRALWPEKPVTAGSGDLVSRYTGLRFLEDTSVGIGQLMEFYVNFGTMGVVVCFFSMGVIVTFIDFMAGQRLLAGDWQRFALWYLTGISFLQVGGSLVEITSSAGASVVTALLVNKLLLDHLQREDIAQPNALLPSPIHEPQIQARKL
jgi:hypothetical protein